MPQHGTSVTGVTSGQQNSKKYCTYVGHCPFSEVQLIYMTFRDLALLLPSSGWCHRLVSIQEFS
jgi:hypothetical protein